MERRTANLLWATLAAGVVVGLLGLLGLGMRVADAEPAAGSTAPMGRWTAYLAPESDCPKRSQVGLPTHVAEEVMLCLVNWARVRARLRPLQTSPLLMGSARVKALDIAACRDFSHTPCGHTFTAPFDQVAYRQPGTRDRVGENLAWGTHIAATPLHAFNGWLNSLGHRENVFRPYWVEQGIAALAVESFEGEGEATLWVSHFGVRG
jgi:uncharacterized protein YkwD